MPGKSIIILLLGMILITGFILSGMLRSSNNISKNMVADYQKKAAYNIAQSGANVGLRLLKNNSAYRAISYSVSDMLGGKVNIRVIDSTLSNGTSVVTVKSTGYTNYGTANQISYTSIAFPPNFIPSSIKGSYTSNSMISTNGNGLVDGRNHNLDGSLTIPGGSGTYGIWSTGSVSIGGSSEVGGTANGIDYAPSGSPNPNILLENQTFPGGYPISPDQIMGGAAKGFPEGTLKSLAMSGVGGSQYLNGSSLQATMAGITFVDINSNGKNLLMNGSGILVFNNTTTSPLTVKLLDGSFTGLVILANNINIDKLHGTIIGAMITTSLNPVGNVAINGNGTIKFSSMAIQNATKNFISKKVVWFER
jgi:hypothetical protein